MAALDSLDPAPGPQPPPGPGRSGAGADAGGFTGSTQADTAMMAAITRVEPAAGDPHDW